MLEAKQQHITGHTRAESQRGPAALFRPCHLVCLLLLCVAIQIKRNRKGPCAAALRKQGYVILFPMQPQSPLTLEPFKCSLMADSGGTARGLSKKNVRAEVLQSKIQTVP